MERNETYELVATVGEYRDGNGETKRRYKKCGILTVNDQGEPSVKLDVVPIGQEWNGWLNGYPPRRDGES